MPANTERSDAVPQSDAVATHGLDVRPQRGEENAASGVSKKNNTHDDRQRSLVVKGWGHLSQEKVVKRAGQHEAGEEGIRVVQSSQLLYVHGCKRHDKRAKFRCLFARIIDRDCAVRLKSFWSLKKRPMLFTRQGEL